MGSRARGFQHGYTLVITQTNTRAKIARQNCHYTRVRTAGSKNLPPPHAGISPSTTTEKEPEKKERATSPYTNRRTKVATHTLKRKRSLSFLSLKVHPPALTLGGKYPIVANAKNLIRLLTGRVGV